MMERFFKKYGQIMQLTFLFLPFTLLNASAQDTVAIKLKIADLAASLDLKDSVAATTDLYLHLDKSVYSTNELLRFSALLVNHWEGNQAHSLHVLLVNDMTQVKVISANYALQTGRASGSFLIPDSLQSGNYSIIAYTNLFPEAKDQSYFRQAIRVFDGMEPPVSLKFTSAILRDSLQIAGKAVTQNGETFNGQIAYQLYADGKLVKNAKTGLGTTGDFTTVIKLPSNLNTIEILGKVTNATVNQGFRRWVKGSENLSQMLFFTTTPQLVPGGVNDISFDLRSLAGKAIAAQLSLLQDGLKIAGFSSDLFGKGNFSFIPRSGKKYSVIIDNHATKPIQSFPLVYNQPSWLLEAIEVSAAALEIKIRAPIAAAECMVLVHNYRQLLYGSYLKLPMQNGSSTIKTADWGEGIVMVGLYNKDGILQAETPVLIKARPTVLAKMSTDSGSYRPFSKVTLTLKLSTTDGAAVKGTFSFAAVLKKALNDNVMNMPHFTNIDRFLPAWSLIKNPGDSVTQADSRSRLRILLGDSNVVSKRLNFFPKSVGFDGQVLFKGSKLKKPIELLLAGKQIQLFKTSDEGFFVLPPSAMRGIAGSKMLLSVIQNPQGHELLLHDRFKEMDDALAKKYFMTADGSKDDFSAAEKNIFVASISIALKEVVISSTTQEPKGVYGKINSSGVCNDYVCRLGFLNCKSHPQGDVGTQEAIDGRTYYIDGLTGTEKVVYHCQYPGMAPYIKTINVVALPDTENLSVVPPNSLENENSTTLYWNSLVETNDRGEAIISFYTNRRKGVFTGTLQGMSAQGAFSAEVNFEVK